MKLRQVRNVVFFVILLGMMSFFVYRKTQPESSSEMVLSIIKKCTTSTNTLNSLDPDCVLANFKETITPENLGEAVSVMEEIYTSEVDAKKLGVPSCHIPAHIAGEVAYEKGATFNQVLNVCGQACSSGCLHGAFQGMFKESGVNLVENLSQSCSIIEAPTDEDIRACWHIVGHGVGEYYGRDLESSIKACVSLPEAKQRWHCISGLRMEHVTPSPRNYETFPQASIDDYLSFCGKFPSEEGFRDDCYSEAAFAATKLFASEEAAIEICSKVPNDPIVKRRCAGGGGLVFYYAYKEDPAAIYNFCQKYKESEMVMDCIIGAVEPTTIERKFEKTGHDLCRLAGEGFERECFSFMGELIERRSGKARREEQCGKLAGLEETYCLEKPQDLRTYYLPPN